MSNFFNKNKDFLAPTVSEVPQTEPKETMWDFIRDIVKFTIIAVVIVAPIRYFIAQPFIVSGESMDPTFANGQYLIIDEITYRMHSPERGDVVIFKYPKDPSKYFIKRIVGLPGETVTVTGGDITIVNKEHSDGMVLNEPYIKNVSFDSVKSVTLKDDEYYAMGDNRANSLDSRYWGPLPAKDLVGRVLVRLFPPNKIGIFPGKETQ